MTPPREAFEAWVNNPHMLDLADSPARWGGAAERVARWEANPYATPGRPGRGKHGNTCT